MTISEGDNHWSDYELSFLLVFVFVRGDHQHGWSWPFSAGLSSPPASPLQSLSMSLEARRLDPRDCCSLGDENNSDCLFVCGRTHLIFVLCENCTILIFCLLTIAILPIILPLQQPPSLTGSCRMSSWTFWKIGISALITNFSWVAIYWWFENQHKWLLRELAVD